MNQWHLKSWVWLGCTLWLLGYPQPIAAQVIPDATLPVGGRSHVAGDPNFQITGGMRQGNNLFHSFRQFSVPTGGSAFFNNAASVRNIFSRVTGGSVSQIDGVIRANGTANLFLLNPNGILLAPHASLNIGGSFVATTATAIGFPNGDVFSSDVTQPLPSQLLTVNPNALFFDQPTPAPIISRSTANDTGLQVSPRQNLLLVGGPVQLHGGLAISPGSYVEFAGVGGVGTVNVSTTRQDWQVHIPNDVSRADVAVRNRGSILSAVNVEGNSGSIRILADTINIFRSSLDVGIPADSGSAQTQTGDIELNATDSISIGNSTVVNALYGRGSIGNINLTADQSISFDSSFVRNYVGQTGVGHMGNINVNTRSFSFTHGSQLSSILSGRANIGSVNINARDRVSLFGYNRFSFSSAIFNVISDTGVGNTRGINITTGSLFLRNSAQITSGTAGRGNSGSVNINARDRIAFDGYRTGGYGTALFNSVEPNAVGNAGDINITTGSLIFTNGPQIISRTRGQGNAGDVNIHARDIVSLDGEAPLLDDDAPDGGNPNSVISTQVTSDAVGQGGDVTITTGSLFLTNGGAVYTNNLGGIGNSGRVTIHARNAIHISGTERLFPDIASGVFTSTTAGAVGNSGEVNITTHSLSVSDRGGINTNAGGQGNAGNIQIQASDRVVFDDGNATSTLADTGVGRGGTIDIMARSLSILNGAQLSATTYGTGNAGNIHIATSDAVTLSGINSLGDISSLQTTTEASATGRGGEIRVEAGRLWMTDGAEVTVSSSSQGQAGSVFVGADQIYLNHSRIEANTSGGGGNITLRSPLILLRNGSNITTNAIGSSIPGGDIAINTQFLVAVSDENSDISANSEDFRGGNVGINAFAVYDIQSRPHPTRLSDITATGATSNLSGTIDITTAGIDPTSGLVELPTDFVDSSQQIAQGCPANQGNSFIVSGRGGLPPNPEQQLDDDADWQDRRQLTVTQSPTSSVPPTPNTDLTPMSTHTPPSEATGWQIAASGKVVLVATTSDSVVQNPLDFIVSCQTRP